MVFWGDIYRILFIFNEFFIGSFFDRFKCFIVEKIACTEIQNKRKKSCSRGTTWKLNCVIVINLEKMKPNYIPCTSANYLPHSLEALLGQQEWWGSRMVLQISVNLFWTKTKKKNKDKQINLHYGFDAFFFPRIITSLGQNVQKTTFLFQFLFSKTF